MGHYDEYYEERANKHAARKSAEFSAQKDKINKLFDSALASVPGHCANKSIVYQKLQEARFWANK